MQHAQARWDLTVGLGEKIENVLLGFHTQTETIEGDRDSFCLVLRGF